MRQRKLGICLLTAVLLLMLLSLGTEKTENDLSVTAAVTVGDTQEHLMLTYATIQDVYLFLPGGAELSQVQLYGATEAAYTVAGQPLTDKGLSCGGFQLNTPYPMTMDYQGIFVEGTITFMRAETVPAAFVDVRSGSMDYIHETKGNEEPGQLRLYDSEGNLNHAGEIRAINGRGHSSWEMPKKSYSLELALDGDLLGMGGAKKWILAANAMDSSNLRNKIVYDFAGDAGLSYSPDCRMVNLYLNGEYAGLYLLCERNEVHSQRVAISSKNSFLVAKDWPWRLRDQGRPYVMTQAQAALRIHHSDMAEETLLALWQSAENAILAEDGIDPVTGKSWEELIDLDSWARKYLVEEVFANTDGTALSQFFYYDGTSSEKIFAGPVWDYDLTMGNKLTVPDRGVHAFFANQPDLHGSPWPAALYEKEAFYSRVAELYETEFRPLLQKLVAETLPAYGSQIEVPAEMNRLRWQGTGETDEIRMLQEYLQARIAFLDGIWLSDTRYHKVQITGKEGYVYNYLVADGDLLPALEDYEDDETTVYHGWFYSDTQEPVDVNKPVTEDMKIYLKFTSAETPITREEPQEAYQEAEKPETPVSKILLMPVLGLGGALVLMILAEVLRGKGGSRKP